MRVSKSVFRRRLGNSCANSMSFWSWVYLLVCSLKFILYIKIAQTIFLTYYQGPTMVHFTLRKAGFQVMNQSLQILFSNTGIPANICWSWRRLQHVFSLTILRLPRRLEDVLKTFSRPLARRLEDVLEDEKLLRWRRLEDVLKTCLEDVLKTSWRRLMPGLMLWNQLNSNSRLQKRWDNKNEFLSNILHKHI